MKKSNKVLLGIGTFWPFVYIPIFMLTIFSTFIFSGGGQPNDAFPLMFLVIMPLHMLTIFGSLALTIFYVVNIFRNPRVEKDKQVLWVALLLLAGMMAAPVYWYLYIWREEPQASQAPPKALNNAEAASWNEASTANQRDKDFATPPPPHSWQD
ncbi:MAG TPA: hypothetical protein VGC66_23165 [Pyrinomonadaceae bacterium]|jgi:hypothetical protein